MKKYVIPTLQSMVIGFIFYSYLLTIGKIYYTESSSTNLLLTAVLLAGLYGIFTTISVYSLQFLTLLVFKNKFSRHKTEVRMMLFAIGVASLYAQISLGQAVFGYQTNILPLSYAVFGFILLGFGAYFYSHDGLEKVEVITFGANVDTAKDCTEHYNSGVAVKNLDELKWALKKYKTRHFILIDLSEEDVTKVVKLLSWTVADVSYLYTGEVPLFSDLNVLEWELSHNFDIVSYDELVGSSFYARGL